MTRIALVKWVRSVLAMAVVAIVAACSTSDTGALSNSFAANERPAGAEAQIYLFRGGFNGYFSTGINDMTMALREQGVPATALSWSSEGSALFRIKRAYRNGEAGPIILAGHSLGAEAVIKMARNLTDAGIPVDLVIVFDALGTAKVPKGVERFVNYKASGRKSNPGNFKPGPGFDGKIVNVDIRTLPQLDRASHWNIVNQERLQQLAVEEIAKAYRTGTRSG